MPTDRWGIVTGHFSAWATSGVLQSLRIGPSEVIIDKSAGRLSRADALDVAAARLGAKPGECLVSVPAAVGAARAAGMRVLGVGVGTADDRTRTDEHACTFVQAVPILAVWAGDLNETREALSRAIAHRHSVSWSRTPDRAVNASHLPRHGRTVRYLPRLDDRALARYAHLDEDESRWAMRIFDLRARELLGYGHRRLQELEAAADAIVLIDVERRLMRESAQSFIGSGVGTANRAEPGQPSGDAR